MYRPALPRVLRAPLLAASVVAAVLVAALALVYADTSTAGPFDAWQLGLMPRDPAFALLFDWLGEPVGFVTMMAALVGLCVALGRFRLAVAAVLAQAATGLACSLLKEAVGRTIHGVFLSYPSGHTAVVTTAGLVTGVLLAEVLRLLRATATTIVLGITLACGAFAGWAQASTAAHYPTDTIGGFCVAVALFAPVALAIDYVGDRWSAAGVTR